ncbi:hypothetical protein ACVRXQ_05345 [Streptococcus panodentis]|uniref:Lipoprotein n=1 Tax=Streptococcus panodentis TaxID=1581472 RepID=A0ABS5AZQ0_9STRE|nr:hypothetical protein [Streptococcus panodentis]MBP2621906.1 hypothetical protein [Streptococcus panodentis]
MKKLHFFIIYGCVCSVLIGGTALYTYFKSGGIAEVLESRFELPAVLGASLEKFDQDSFYMDRQSESTYLEDGRLKKAKTVKQLTVAESPYLAKLYESYDDQELTHYFSEDRMYLEGEDGFETLDDTKARQYIDGYSGISSFKALLEAMADNESELTKKKVENGYEFSVTAEDDLAYDLIDAFYYAYNDEHYDPSISIEQCQVSFVVDPKSRTIQSIDMELELDQDTALDGELVHFKQRAVFKDYGKTTVRLPNKIKEKEAKSAV